MMDFASSSDDATSKPALSDDATSKPASSDDTASKLWWMTCCMYTVYCNIRDNLNVRETLERRLKNLKCMSDMRLDFSDDQSARELRQDLSKAKARFKTYVYQLKCLPYWTPTGTSFDMFRVCMCEKAILNLLCKETNAYNLGRWDQSLVYSVQAFNLLQLRNEICSEWQNLHRISARQNKDKTDTDFMIETKVFSALMKAMYTIPFEADLGGAVACSLVQFHCENLEDEVSSLLHYTNHADKPSSSKQELCGVIDDAIARLRRFKEHREIQLTLAWLPFSLYQHLALVGEMLCEPVLLDRWLAASFELPSAREFICLLRETRTCFADRSVSVKPLLPLREVKLNGHHLGPDLLHYKAPVLKDSAVEHCESRCPGGHITPWWVTRFRTPNRQTNDGLTSRHRLQRKLSCKRLEKGAESWVIRDDNEMCSALRSVAKKTGGGHADRHMIEEDAHYSNSNVQEASSSGGSWWVGCEGIIYGKPENKIDTEKLMKCNKIDDDELQSLILTYIQLYMDSRVILGDTDMDGRVTNFSPNSVYHGLVLKYDPLTNTWFSRPDVIKILDTFPVEVRGANRDLIRCDLSNIFSEQTSEYYDEIASRFEELSNKVGKQFRVLANHRFQNYLREARTTQIACYYIKLFGQATNEKYCRLRMLPVEVFLIFMNGLRENVIEYMNVEYFMENRYKGQKFVKFTNNKNYRNKKVDTSVVEAFAHFTHQESDGVLLITDLQGWAEVDSQGDFTIYLTDPAIICPNAPASFFGNTNIGVEAMNEFWKKVHPHCNHVCRDLKLTRPSSY